MEIIIFILIGVIGILSLYLFLLKKEIKRTTKTLKNMQNQSSNILLNKEFNDKSMESLMLEINLLLKAINEKETNIYTKNKSLKKMIINIAHDLRTPLTSAIGYIDIIKSRELSDKDKKRYLSIIEERLNKLSYLITNFFDFSKVILLNEEIELEKENIIVILENTIINFYDDFSKDERKIDLNCKVNKLELITNKALLTRIFDNLIINAYKHSNSDLIINLDVIDNKIKIEFRNELVDNTLDVKAMFEEFYTADISRTKENTGLGLAIVKEFAQLLKGNIHAEKEKKSLKIVITL